MSGKVLRWTWAQAALRAVPFGLAVGTGTFVGNRGEGFLADTGFALGQGLLAMGLATVLGRALVSTQLYERALMTRTVIFDRTIAWAEVAVVEERCRWGIRHPVLRGWRWMPGPGRYEIVDVPLRVPVDGRLLPDPDFDAKVEEIRTWWLTHRANPAA